MGDLLGAWDVREDSWPDIMEESNNWLCEMGLDRIRYTYRVEFCRAVDGEPRAIFYCYDSKDGHRYLNPDRKVARALPIEVSLKELPPQFRDQSAPASQRTPDGNPQ